MSIFQLFSRRQSITEGTSSDSSHLKYSSFCPDPKATSFGVPSLFDSPPAAPNAGIKASKAVPVNINLPPSYDSNGRNFILQRHLSISTPAPPTHTRLSSTFIMASIPPPPFDTPYSDVVRDHHVPTTTTGLVPLQSYPGERIPRESYVQLNPDSGKNESVELRNRGSSVFAGISVVTNTIIGVAILGVPW